MDSETDLGSDVGSETDLGSGRALGRTWAQGWALCLALFNIAGKSKPPIKLTQPYAKPSQGQRAVSAANCQSEVMT